MRSEARSFGSVPTSVSLLDDAVESRKDERFILVSVFYDTVCRDRPILTFLYIGFEHLVGTRVAVLAIAAWPVPTALAPTAAQPQTERYSM